MRPILLSRANDGTLPALLSFIEPRIGESGGSKLEEFGIASAAWIDAQPCIELEIGSLVAAASEWTEDEMELDDLVSGLVESGRIELSIG